MRGILACLKDCEPIAGKVRYRGMTMHTLLALMVLEELHALKRSGARDKLMGELGLVVWLIVASIIVVHLLVVVLSVVWQ